MLEIVKNDGKLHIFCKTVCLFSSPIVENEQDAFDDCILYIRANFTDDVEVQYCGTIYTLGNNIPTDKEFFAWAFIGLAFLAFIYKAFAG